MGSDGWLSTALILVTVIYTFVTWRMSKHSKVAAEASRDASQAAERAAVAAQRSADVAEASLAVDFEVSLSRRSDVATTIYVTPSVNVWIYGVALHVTVLDHRDTPGYSSDRLSLQAPESFALPQLLYAGSPFNFEWEDSKFRKSDYAAYGFLYVTYSFSEAGTQREKPCYFETREGIGRWALERLGLREPREEGPGAAEPRS